MHGGIDGFSQFIVYLYCSNNNKSQTVFHLYESAVRDYGLPDRVRSDKGGENIKVTSRIITFQDITWYVIWIILCIGYHDYCTLIYLNMN